ncbi:hypothetical protein B9Z19DRAFT_1192979 [Tuber borchii]|uniref:Aminoglycoside phosphotransferase domain-containing protein n=1 Tax=Tuber borchii TaxID=42251 RepID=A0A2T6ZU01_TUBBO|nr:hypothetical protein B9Z19DRAFT_1192979 [Tuber borchii]
MTKFIYSDSDLRASLNTGAKQNAKAKELALSHLNIRAMKARSVDIQGFFSRTLIVTTESGKIIVQLRVEPLDIDIFRRARQALGDVVPDIAKIRDEALEREEIWPYYMTFIPGRTWQRSAAFCNRALNVTCAKSLGRSLSHGFSAMVDEENRPRANQIKPFREDTQRLLDNSDQLKTLPLFISHADLNHVNILVQEDGEVSGIVDWELSSDLPFGMGCCRIHDLVGRFTVGEFHMPEGFEDAERGFWEAILDGIPTDVRRVLDTNLYAVQTSIHIGALLDTLDIQSDSFNLAGLKALPKFLTYRIPALRGQEPPYILGERSQNMEMCSLLAHYDVNPLHNATYSRKERLAKGRVDEKREM